MGMPCTGELYYRTKSASFIPPGFCVEACLGASVGTCSRELIVGLAELQKGNCQSTGYTLLQAHQVLEQAPCGKIDLHMYSQAAHVTTAAPGTATTEAASTTTIATTSTT